MSDAPVESEQPVTAAPTPANPLAAARNAAGIALADAARQLKLSPWQVEALESGDYARLPGPVFVRGFIRNYARLLKIDPGPLLAEIASQSQAEAVITSESEASTAIPFPGQSSFNWRPYAIGVLIVVAALVGYEFYGDDGEAPAVDSHAVELPQPKVVPEVIDGAAKSNESNASAPAPAAVVATPPAAVVAPAPAPRVEAAAAPVAAPVETRASVDRAPGEQVVRLMFTRESWVEVRDRQGRVIFSQLNAAGSAQAVSGQPPLRLVVGNASGVRVMFNDRLIDLAPHTQVDVARLNLE
jgi:cytoskeleton protein RodZ